VENFDGSSLSQEQKYFPTNWVRATPGGRGRCPHRPDQNPGLRSPSWWVRMQACNTKAFGGGPVRLGVPPITLRLVSRLPTLLEMAGSNDE